MTMNAVGQVTLPNLRDVGGHTTRDGGRVVERQLYRSSALTGLTAADVAALGRLGLRTVFDLRSPAEREAARAMPCGRPSWSVHRAEAQ